VRKKVSEPCSCNGHLSACCRHWHHSSMRQLMSLPRLQQQTTCILMAMIMPAEYSITAEDLNRRRHQLLHAREEWHHSSALLIQPHLWCPRVRRRPPARSAAQSRSWREPRSGPGRPPAAAAARTARRPPPRGPRASGTSAPPAGWRAPMPWPAAGRCARSSGFPVIYSLNQVLLQCTSHLLLETGTALWPGSEVDAVFPLSCPCALGMHLMAWSHSALRTSTSSYRPSRSAGTTSISGRR
jgi:hypothetical protein